MDERERLLAEGPREAPEPESAEPIPVGETAPPLLQPESAEPPATKDPAPARSGPSPLYRLVPLVLVGLLVGARALGIGGPARFVVVAAIPLVGLLAYLRRRNR